MAMVQAPDFQSMRIGAVLQQGGHPIAYFSKSLSLKHQALSTYEKEFYAVIMAIEKWKGYLLDRHFKIKTDHFRLKYLLDQRFTTPFWAKWLPKLLGYDYEISYKKRSENTVANALSRISSGTEFNDDQLRKQLLTYFHCDPIGGHSGVQTFLPVPTKVWNDISMDFIEALPPSQGKTVLFVVVDKLSKYAYFIPMSHLFTASQVAQVFLDHVYKLYAKGMGQMGILSRILVQYQFSYLCPRPLPMRVYDQPPNVHLPYLAGTSSIEEVVRTMQAREQAIAMLQFHLKSPIDRPQLDKEHIISLEPSFMDHSSSLPKLEKWPTSCNCQRTVKFNLFFMFSRSCAKELIIKWESQCGPNGVLSMEPEAIIGRQLGKLNNNTVMYVLVMWVNQAEEYATWELYAHLIRRFPETELHS
ncbi:putative mitochondrial protein [Tanacetum coccineum]